MPGTQLKSILVVEDDKLSQNIISRILKTRNYKVSTAANGKIAIQMMEKQTPDLVLLDVMMPEVSGMDTLKWIKSNHPDVPVIMLSCLDQQGKAAKEAKALGAVDFIGKPPDFQLLLEKIEKILAQGSAN
jgi:DNA-binding response OmpR family regulator